MANSELVGASPPCQVLFQFFEELLVLNDFAMSEVKQAEANGRELDTDDLLARRVAIRARYCTPRKRKTDRVVSYGPLEKTAYDRANIVLKGEETDAKGRVLITVHNTALHEQWRYTLLERQGQWLIDCLEFKDGRKWMPVPLH